MSVKHFARLFVSWFFCQTSVLSVHAENEASNRHVAHVPIAQAATNSIAIATVKVSNLLAAANTQTSTSRSESSSTTMGLVGDVVGRQTFYGTTANMQDGSQTAVSQSTSVLSANKGNLVLTADAANALLESHPTAAGTSDAAGIQATQGDITATAAKLQAENITLDAAKNVNLIAAANLETNTSSNHSDSVGVGVTVGLGQNSGISFQLRAAQAQGRSNGTETTYDNTQVTASKNLTVKSGSDTNLIGAQLAGETVKMEVGTSGKGGRPIVPGEN